MASYRFALFDSEYLFELMRVSGVLTSYTARVQKPKKRGNPDPQMVVHRVWSVPFSLFASGEVFYMIGTTTVQFQDVSNRLI